MSIFARAGIATEQLLALDDAGLREVGKACLELAKVRSSRAVEVAAPGLSSSTGGNEADNIMCSSTAISPDCPEHMQKSPPLEEQIRATVRNELHLELAALRDLRTELDALKESRVLGSSAGGSSIMAMTADHLQGTSSGSTNSKRAQEHGDGAGRGRAVALEEVSFDGEEAEVYRLEGISWAQQQNGHLLQLDSSPSGTVHGMPDARRSALGKRQSAAAGEDESTFDPFRRRVTRSSRSTDKEAEMVEAAIDQMRSGYKNVTCLAANPGYQDGMVRRLQGGMMTDNGAKMLAPQVGSFVGLDLSGNRIGPQGIAALAPGIVSSATLSSVVLAGNPLGNEGATCLADILRRNTSITELNLQQCDIDLEGAKALADAIQTNTKMLSFGNFAPRLRTNCMDATRSARSLNVAELRLELDERGLSTEGDRNMLVHRMQEVLDQYQTPVAAIRQTLARNHRILVENKLTAFAMGVHARLGAASAVHMLSEVSTCVCATHRLDLLHQIAQLVLQQFHDSGH